MDTGLGAGVGLTEGDAVGGTGGRALGPAVGAAEGSPVGLGLALVGTGRIPVGAGLGTALGPTLGWAVTTGTGDGLAAMQGAGMGEGGGAAFKMIGVGGAVGLGEGDAVGSSTMPGGRLPGAEAVGEGDGLGDGAVVSSGCGAALTETHGASWVNCPRAILPYGLAA
ncbi:MAG: hypothetical protein GIW98_03865 [Candidatus Eremiobacteraeota bacterium]|nr:hypothetical protein [Candidatus Eremiobacteraeota bacterium]